MRGGAIEIAPRHRFPWKIITRRVAHAGWERFHGVDGRVVHDVEDLSDRVLEANRGPDRMADPRKIGKVVHVQVVVARAQLIVHDAGALQGDLELEVGPPS